MLSDAGVARIPVEGILIPKWGAGISLPPSSKSVSSSHRDERRRGNKMLYQGKRRKGNKML